MPDVATRMSLQPPGLDPDLMSLVYDELRGIARRVVRGEHDERSLAARAWLHRELSGGRGGC